MLAALPRSVRSTLALALSLPLLAAAGRSSSMATAATTTASGSSCTKVEPAAAAELMKQGYKYLDVRTPQEFAAGHVPASVNIPSMLASPSGMQPNPEFLSSVKKAFPKADTQLVVGCKSGTRSAKACSLLSQERFSQLVDQMRGFDGWVAAGLPVEK